jgi:hypothetical protein
MSHLLEYLPNSWFSLAFASFGFTGIMLSGRQAKPTGKMLFTWPFTQI